MKFEITSNHTYKKKYNDLHGSVFGLHPWVKMKRDFTISKYEL